MMQTLMLCLVPLLLSSAIWAGRKAAKNCLRGGGL